MGVSPSGAADAVALRLGNRLVENEEAAPGLEMTLLGGTFLFPNGGVMALTGSDFSATLDEIPVDLWTSTEVRAGQKLRLGPTKSRARCYLSIQGGIAVKPFLGSASTHLLSGLGGFQGRALRKGDVLEIGTATATPFRRRVISPNSLQRLSPRKVLGVTAGPHMEKFPTGSRQLFYSSRYRVREDSNRMGLRLEGQTVPADVAGEMLSEGIALGAIQVPESGQPIISFVEQQTTGGYPILANVISADFSSVGQLRPRDEIQFEQVSMEQARTLFIEQEHLLASKDLILE
jgi:antagonist of KipI